jgi:hypothetical protein
MAAPTWLKAANNAITTLAEDMTDSQLTLNLTSIADMPATYPVRLTLWDSDTYGTINPAADPDLEIVEVTGLDPDYSVYMTGDQYTVVRARESTLAAAHSDGNTAALLITAGMWQQLQDEFDLLEARVTALEGA